MLTIYMLGSSVDNLCKHFGTIRGPMQRRALSASNLLVTLMVILKYFFFKKVNFKKKNQQTTKRSKTILSMQRVKVLLPYKSDAS